MAETRKGVTSAAPPPYASVDAEDSPHPSPRRSSSRSSSGCTGKPKPLPLGLVKAVLLATIAFSMSGYDQGVADAAMMNIRAAKSMRAMQFTEAHEAPSIADEGHPKDGVGMMMYQAIRNSNTALLQMPGKWAIPTPIPDDRYGSNLIDVTKEEEELAIGILNLAAALGALVGGVMSDSYGRKRTLVLSNVVYVVGCCTISICRSYYLLVAGRIIMGLGIGVSLVVCPIYIAELAPKENRGNLVSMTDFGLDIASVAGFAVAYWFINVLSGWRFMMLIGCLPPAFVLIMSRCWLPESPRWLVSRGRDADANQALRQLGFSMADVSEQLTSIQHSHQTSVNEAKATWMETMYPRDQVVRVMVFTGLSVALFSQATGTEATINYIPEIMRDEAEIRDTQSDLLISMTVACAQVLALFVASFFFDRYGRRPMLIIGAIGLTAAFLIAALAVITDSPALAIIGVFGVVTSFATGFSPLTYVVCAEVFPSRLRAKAMSLAIFTTRSIAGIISLLYLSLENALTAVGINVLFAVVSIGSLVFIIMCVPETMGLGLEDVEALFRTRLRERAKLLPDK